MPTSPPKPGSSQPKNRASSSSFSRAPKTLKGTLTNYSSWKCVERLLSPRISMPVAVKNRQILRQQIASYKAASQSWLTVILFFTDAAWNSYKFSSFGIIIKSFPPRKATFIFVLNKLSFLNFSFALGIFIQNSLSRSRKILLIMAMNSFFV